MDVRIDSLKEVLKDLVPKDYEFANDLINGKHGYVAKNSLSDKQWYWVKELTKRGEEKRTPSLFPPESKTENVGSMKGLINMFSKAKEKLKYPRLYLEIDGVPVRLSIAGPNSKKTGSVVVTDGGPYGDNKFYGWVSPEGLWEKSMRLFPETNTILRLLKRVSEDPVKAAAEHGHMHGRCCMCNLELSDERSTKVGYGPVCAKNWGLPWGEK